MRIIILYSVFLLIASSGIAQSNLNAAGNGSENNQGAIDFSVGQLFNSQHQSNGFTVNQGIQLPFEIYKLPVSVLQKDIDGSVSLYPNPAKTLIHVDSDFENLSLQVSNGQGEIISVIKESNISFINLEDWPTGMYFFLFTSKSLVVGKYKVIKL